MALDDAVASGGPGNRDATESGSGICIGLEVYPLFVALTLDGRLDAIRQIGNRKRHRARKSAEVRDRDDGICRRTLIQEELGRSRERKSAAGDRVVDSAGILRGQPSADEIVVEPHEYAVNAALSMPAGHDRLDLTRSVDLIP